jgi:hypothetical protein
MLDPLILALIVEALKRLAELYLPTLPITVELINAVILLLFGWSALLAVRAGVRKFAPKVFELGALFLKD